MKLLLVEDEQRIAEYVKKGLEHAGHVVDVVHDGHSGYDMARNEQYDVLIIDRMLPGKTGTQLCSELRAQHIHTPILLLTALSGSEETVTGLEAGADDYLSKPFSFPELVARVAALGRRPAQMSSPKLICGSLQLDTQKKRVTRRGTQVQLSKKEYDLLEFFMRNPNKVMSKEQITQQVWEFDSTVLSNTAQVYIGYLRSKIDEAFPDEPPLIHTVRGFGYRFGSE